MGYVAKGALLVEWRLLVITSIWLNGGLSAVLL